MTRVKLAANGFGIGHQAVELQTQSFKVLIYYHGHG